MLSLQMGFFFSIMSICLYLSWSKVFLTVRTIIHWTTSPQMWWSLHYWKFWKGCWMISWRLRFTWKAGPDDVLSSLQAWPTPWFCGDLLWRSMPESLSWWALRSDRCRVTEQTSCVGWLSPQVAVLQRQCSLFGNDNVDYWVSHWLWIL